MDWNLPAGMRRFNRHGLLIGCSRRRGGPSRQAGEAEESGVIGGRAAASVGGNSKKAVRAMTTEIGRPPCALAPIKIERRSGGRWNSA